jgi:DNA-binding NtrC family response regulator
MDGGGSILMDTRSDVHSRPGERDSAVVHALHIAFHGYEPLRVPSRHLLGDIDVVDFGRGASSVHRERRDGLRTLVVRIPDPLMSASHGRLVRAHGTWIIDDLCSKNAIVVGGIRTRSCRIADGQVFSLGNTIAFVGYGDRGAPLDVDATALAAPRPELATFEPALRERLARMARLAPCDTPMLVLGETGTGKEVVARAIHELSGRRGPWVAVNCAAIAPTLLEAELFGHRRAAFSGALSDRLGHVRTSDHGTLFLDEVAELSLPAQAALLRVLQEREVVPIGDTLPIAVDLRVVTATNRDLVGLVAEGRFREDLYARLAGFTVTLPPLRARRSDLGLVIAALLRRKPHADGVTVTWRAATRLFWYAWPRNIRELEHVLGGAVALAGREPIALEHLPDAIRAAHEPELLAPVGVGRDPSARFSPEDQARKGQLEELLRAHGGNLAEVARALGKDRTQIYRWMRRFGLPRRSADAQSATPRAGRR